jgi:predicted Zn-dependent protease
VKLALAATLLLGCAPRPAELHVSPDFTPAEQAAVLAAAEQWNAALGETALEPRIGACPSDGICIAPATSPVAGDAHGADETSIGVTVGELSRTTSYLYVDRIAYWGWSVQATALHELGHAMELVHHAPGTAMAAFAHEQSVTVTADDVEQWRGAHR